MAANLLDDPNQVGLLSLGLRLLSTPGKFGQALGTAGLGAMGDMEQAKQAQAMAQQRLMQQEMQRMQLETIKRQQAEQDKQRAAVDQFRAQIPSPLGAANAQAAQSGAPLGTMAAAAAQPKIDPQELMMYQAMQAGLLSPLDYVKAKQKDNTPIKLGAGETLLQPGTYKPLFTNPKEDALPSSVREYQFAQGQGYQGTFEQFQTAQKKAGATNIGLPKIDIKVGESTAAQIGPMLRESREKAIAGVKLVDSGNRVLQAVEAGNVIAGPLANLRLRGAQAADVLGIGGASNSEKIANTRSVVRAMAEQAVAARSQLGGQAQISNSEQELLTRATAGDIADLTIREVKQIADLNIVLGKQLHGGHEQMMRGLASSPGTENLRPYFQAPTLPDARSAAGAVRKYNPATGRIE